MNLRNIVRGAITSINPDVLATIMQSTGYTIDTDGTQVPQYTIVDNVPVQVQALSNDELHQLEGLNIQGNKFGVYLNGDYSGLIRRTGQGGDLVVLYGTVWLATIVLENWGIPGTADAWVKLAITQQTDAAVTPSVQTLH
jgi:hypothetical protein